MSSAAGYSRFPYCCDRLNVTGTLAQALCATPLRVAGWKRHFATASRAARSRLREPLDLSISTPSTEPSAPADGDEAETEGDRTPVAEKATTPPLSVSERVLDALAASTAPGGWVVRKDLLAAIGGTESRVTAAIDDLLRAGRVKRGTKTGRGGTRHYYRLARTGQDGDETKEAK